MRSNGLTAATYTPVADLNPQLADALLADLKTRGVAAYTKPVESTTAAGFDRPEYRDGVKDRLYVDTVSADDVRAILAAHDPELVQANDDLAWEQLVAGFDQAPQLAVNPWPENENLSAGEGLVDERDLATPDDADDDTDKPRLRWGSRRSDESSDDQDFLATTARGREDSDDLDEVHPADRFVPPEPPPLPKLQPYQLLAWIGLIGGPGLLLISALLSYRLPPVLLALAIVGFIGGLVTLVATMGNGRDDDWDSGNGAVV